MKFWNIFWKFTFNYLLRMTKLKNWLALLDWKLSILFSLSFLNEGCNYWERSNEVQPRKLSSFGCDCWRRERYHLPSQISNIIKKKPKEYKSEIRAITLLWGREERAENHVKHPSNYHHANAIKNPKPWKSIILRCVLECIKLFARGSLYRINPLFSKNEMKILSLDFLLHLCS